MTERSFFWDGTTGDGGPYDSGEMMDRCFRAILNGTGNQGVLTGWLNELEVTDGGANTAIVLTGGSIVYGLFHESDANVNVNVPNGPRTDLIIVRRSWAAQTARITRIAGPGAVLTQTPDVTYDIPLAEVDVDAGGNLTITDTREYCAYGFTPGAGSVPTAGLADDAVTTAKLENQARWRLHGAGMLKQDATDAPVWSVLDFFDTPGVSVTGNPLWAPANVGWRMGEEEDGAASLDGLWLTERVPEDFTGTDLDIYIWNTPSVDEHNVFEPTAVTGDVVWDWYVWAGASGAAFVAQSGTMVLSNADRYPLVEDSYGRTYRKGINMYRDYIGTITIAAGELVHLAVFRDGLDGLDTCNRPTRLMAVELSYTADS